MTDLVERVCAPGDLCGVCGDDLEPGDLGVWTDRDGRIHELCAEEAETFPWIDSERGTRWRSFKRPPT